MAASRNEFLRAIDSARAAAMAVRDEINAAGPPCWRCRHFVAEECQHPAYMTMEFQRSTGRVKVRGGAGTRRARSDNGLCGLEGRMFERRLLRQWAYDTVPYVGAITLLFGPTLMVVLAIIFGN